MLRNKSRSPPSAAAPCTLEDALEFDARENVLTAYEQMQRLHETSQQPTADNVRRGKNFKNGRRQYGRAVSMTFGNRQSKYDNLNEPGSRIHNPIRFWDREELQSGNTGCHASRSSLSPDQMVFRDAPGSTPILDGFRCENIDFDERLRHEQTCISSLDTATTPKRLVHSRRHSSNVESLDHSFEFENNKFKLCKNLDTTRLEFGAENRVVDPRIDVRRKVLRRSETLPNTETKFFDPCDDILSSSCRRSFRRSPTLDTIPQRSHSLSCWTTKVELESLAEFCLDSTDRWLIENADPSQFNILNNRSSNDLDYVETDNFNLDERGRGRKKRCARRHSIQGNLFVDRSVESRLVPQNQISGDPTLSWLLSNAQSLTDERAFREFSETGETLETANSSSHNSCLNTSPSTRSVASSRKRGASDETPPSDMEDWSMSGVPTSLQSNGSLSSRRTRSRSRIFSPLPGMQFPVPPPLISSVSTAHLPTVGNVQTFELEPNRHREVHRIENIPDTDDEEDSNDNPSPDVSMDSGYDGFAILPEKPTQEQCTLKKENVFRNFSSYDDLKFMIKTLRSEHCRAEKVPFGYQSTVDVVPPNAWSSQRRIAFFQWARIHLGFTVRSAGFGVNYLQTSKAKGMNVLSILESALSEYKQIECNKEKDIEAPVFVQTLLSNNGKDGSNRNIFDQQPAVGSLSIMTSPVPLVDMALIAKDEITASLTSKLESLTMKEDSVLTTTRNYSSLSRLVTLDSTVAQEPKQANAPRCSMEGSLNNNYNLMLHLHGEHSPRSSLPTFLKPPRLSLESVHTVTSMSVGCIATPFGLPSLPPFQNFDTVATPLMNEAKGWGSHPVAGKDWGCSLKCDDHIIKEMLIRFEGCGIDGRRESIESICPLPPRRRSWNNLDFDIEANGHPEEDIQDELQEDSVDNKVLSSVDEKKFIQRRLSAMNKRRRMSLWASASQVAASILPIRKAKLPARSTSLCPLVETYVFGNCLNCDEEGSGDIYMKPVAEVATNAKIISNMFSFLTENELLRIASGVCVSWADLAALSIANRLQSFGIYSDDEEVSDRQKPLLSVMQSMERSWSDLHQQYPWACFLAEGGAKKVFKVHNSFVGKDEALSVMDTFEIQSKQIVANELAISALLSSLSRRGICPNFVITRGVFTCAHMPPASHWGNSKRKNPKGNQFCPNKLSRQPKEPKEAYPGRYQYVRMELINEGDAEELMKRQPDSTLSKDVAQVVLFQIAFALHAAADKFSMKHYDVKLLNIFLQKIDPSSTGDVVLRYGLGSHVFALRMPRNNAYIAKLADFGTANINVESNGQPVTIAQFTTLENTPPDFMILGDDARQGHGHDNFGLGLCMLHLFTGGAPYEEILEEVKCPSNFKKRLRAIWESEKVDGYSIIYSLINDGVIKDEAGHIVEGEPDETFYDTLYRYLVLFGVPMNQFEQKQCPKVWKAIADSFMNASDSSKSKGKQCSKRSGSDRAQYNRDCRKYSLKTGNDKRISTARNSLQSVDGGMELLFRLCSFDPMARASALEVLNSTFMETLRESPDIHPEIRYSKEMTLFEYNAFSTQHNRS